MATKEDVYGYDQDQDPPSYTPYATNRPTSPQPQYGQPYGARVPYVHNNTTTVVVNQPGPSGAVILTQRHRDYMLSSILACLCCFWPTGICAIYYASQANSAAEVGDFETARRMANNARNMVITSIIVGIICVIVVIVLRVTVYPGYNRGY